MLRSFVRTFASPGIALLFPLFVQAQALPLSVGTATAAPGQKSTGYLEVPAGVDAATNIPVIVINGEKRGPVLALVSGAHGTEYTSDTTNSPDANKRGSQDVPSPTVRDLLIAGFIAKAFLPGRPEVRRSSRG